MSRTARRPRPGRGARPVRPSRRPATAARGGRRHCAGSAPRPPAPRSRGRRPGPPGTGPPGRTPPFGGRCAAARRSAASISSGPTAPAAARAATSTAASGSRPAAWNRRPQARGDRAARHDQVRRRRRLRGRRQRAQNAGAGQRHQQVAVLRVRQDERGRAVQARRRLRLRGEVADFLDGGLGEPAFRQRQPGRQVVHEQVRMPRAARGREAPAGKPSTAGGAGAGDRVCFWIVGAVKRSAQPKGGLAGLLDGFWHQTLAPPESPWDRGQHQRGTRRLPRLGAARNGLRRGLSVRAVLHLGDSALPLGNGRMLAALARGLWERWIWREISHIKRCLAETRHPFSASKNLIADRVPHQTEHLNIMCSYTTLPACCQMKYRLGHRHRNRLYWAGCA